MCNIFIFESKESFSVAFGEVSCHRTWEPGSRANLSAVLWIWLFRGKIVCSLLKSYESQKGLLSFLLQVPYKSSSGKFHVGYYKKTLLNGVTRGQGAHSQYNSQLGSPCSCLELPMLSPWCHLLRQQPACGWVCRIGLSTARSLFFIPSIPSSIPRSPLLPQFHCHDARSARPWEARGEVQHCSRSL